jgi:Na+/serine symporter
LTFVTVICGRVVGLALIVIIAPVTALLATATALLGSLLGDALKCISGLTGHY